MFYANLLNQITLLVFVCISFFIFIFNNTLNKEQTYIKLFGSAFIIPFSLSVASFLLSKDIYAKPLIIVSEISIFIIFFLFFKLKPNTKRYNLLFWIIMITPIILFLALYYFDFIRKYIVLIQVYAPIIIVTTLLSMILLKNKKGIQSLLFWAMFSELLSGTVIIIGTSYVLNMISTLLKLIAFSIFTIYFYKEIFQNVMKIVVEAEKRLTAVNKTLDLEVKKRVFEIELSNEKLVAISKTDSLTNALNKAGIMDKIDHFITKKGNKEFCILMFDIDSFKSINDSLGHIVGDKCLKRLSLLAKGSLRDVDKFGRYGGDEFIVVLPDTSLSQAKIIAERFRLNVSNTASPNFTISLGIASFPLDGSNVKELIAVADQGLYVSKKKGKNSISYINDF